jgi:hypothetical protein
MIDTMSVIVPLARHHARSRKLSGSSRKCDGGQPCSFHLPPGALPARHTWEQCSENPWNSKAHAEPHKSKRRRDTAYMADPRYRSSDDSAVPATMAIRRQVTRATIPMERSAGQKKRPSKLKKYKVVASEDEGPEDTFLANHDPLDMDSE